MRDIITMKSGGSSNATDTQVEKVIRIFKENSKRGPLVPSAMGKDPNRPDSRKATDRLIEIASGINVDGNIQSLLDDHIRLVRKLGLPPFVEALIHDTLTRDIRNRLGLPTHRDYIKTRGESLMAAIYGSALGVPVHSAEHTFFFREDGTCDAERTMAAIRHCVGSQHRCVIEGFSGVSPDGSVRAFPRGGSDTSGSWVAASLGASLYENWTDTPGICTADPRIVGNRGVPLRYVPQMTFPQLFEFAGRGADVFQQDAVEPVRNAGIPIHVRNTNAPQELGTRIVPATSAMTGIPTIVGIGGERDFTVLKLATPRMNDDPLFTSHLVQALVANGVSLDHIMTGMNTMTVMIANKHLTRVRRKLFAELREEHGTDVVEARSGFAVVCVVGTKLGKHPGKVGRLFIALEAARIETPLFSQGAHGMSLVLGINEKRFEDAIIALYDASA